ncbi:hypothetical protein NC653_011712 [Populus alba x Populus x berolinensis]|uniref:ATP synthase subunit e, mitochondrial n=2 Tax=Populus TaxID=3689 RepID=A0AAD6R371_9ROSI|nr:hypothetical protein NC653_011712 [Populus alba x Populus x berolinensis]
MIVVVVCARPSHLSFLSSRKLLLELGCVNVNSSVKQDGPISHGVCKELQALSSSLMAPPPGPYSGTSTLALVARVSAFSLGLVYGSVKLKYLQSKAKSQKKAEAKAHH